LLDGNTIMSYGLEFAPALAAILAAAFGVWIVWRLVRGALNALFRKREERPEPVAYSIIQERREPVLGQPAAPSPSSSPSIPDVADILALKASIDALTRQIASLEKRLVPASGSLSSAVAAPNAGDHDPRASVKPPLAS
jgi:hypothetical protein